MNHLRETWNKSAGERTELRNPSFYAIEKERLFPRHSLVCDLGGGAGSDALYFVSMGHKVDLLDISDAALEIVAKESEKRKISNNISFIQYDMSKGILPLADDTYDIIYSRLSLHYFRPEILYKIFEEIYRSLKIDGSAYITMKSPDDYQEMEYLRSTANKLEDYVFTDEWLTRARYPIDALESILEPLKCNLKELSIVKKVENIDISSDKTNSGATKLLVNEISFCK